MEWPIVRIGSLTYPYNPQKWPSQCEVTVEAESLPVSIGEAMTFLRVYDQQDPDTIGALIDAGTHQIERVTGRDLVTKTRQAYWDFYGRQVWLPYGPHGAVTEVKAVTDDGVERVLVEGTDYRVYRTQFKVIDILQWYGRQLFVTYESGYAVGECPNALKMGVLQEVSFQYKNRQDPDLGSGISYGGITLETRHLIQPYIRINF